MPEAHGTLHAVVRDVIADIAPGELPVVEGLAHLDESTVTRRFRASRGKREPLGFGLEDVVLVTVPVLWIVVEHAARSATDSALGYGGRRLASLFRRRRRGRTVVPALTPEQLRETHKAAIEEALRQGMPEKDAVALADALHRRLTIGLPEALPELPPGS